MLVSRSHSNFSEHPNSLQGKPSYTFYSVGWQPAAARRQSGSQLAVQGLNGERASYEERREWKRETRPPCLLACSILPSWRLTACTRKRVDSPHFSSLSLSLPVCPAMDDCLERRKRKSARGRPAGELDRRNRPQTEGEKVTRNKRDMDWLAAHMLPLATYRAGCRTNGSGTGQNVALRWNIL